VIRGSSRSHHALGQAVSVVRSAQLRGSLASEYSGDANSVEELVRFVQSQDLRVTCLEVRLPPHPRWDPRVDVGFPHLYDNQGELQACTSSLAKTSAERDSLQLERDNLRLEVNQLTEALLKVSVVMVVVKVGNHNKVLCESVRHRHKRQSYDGTRHQSGR
jgi:hypothetical protein